MKKILFVATVTQHFYYFHLPYMKMFRDLGWQVDVASSGDMELPNCNNRYEIPFKRSPFDKGNLKAYKELKKLIKDNHYDIIHCHTPMGGMLTRLCAISERKNGTKVLYTAHGFHFYKGAPLLNWLVYFPIEYVLSHFTDCLITINDEDFNCATKHLKAKTIKKVNGVGYNSDLYYPIDNDEKLRLRAKLGYSERDKLLIYVAEMNKNKNQQMLIHTVKKLRDRHPEIKLLIVGADNCSGEYINLANKLGTDANVDFLGHRDDASDLVHASDIAVGSSLREGLPVNLMEALACGLPAVFSDNRGHRALIENDVNGYIVPVNGIAEMVEKISAIFDNNELYSRLSNGAINEITPYSKDSVLVEMEKIYNQYIN